MPDYLSPGVYIEDTGHGPRPIEGVPVSTAALLGETERGTIKPHLITSYADDPQRDRMGGIRSQRFDTLGQRHGRGIPFPA
jgi:phage tail sheath protein FI